MTAAAAGKPRRRYVAVGIVADNGSNEGMAGQVTYLMRTSDWFAWDGDRLDHAAMFATRELAMAAAWSCAGPIFRMPCPDSVHAVEAPAATSPAGVPSLDRLGA